MIRINPFATVATAVVVCLSALPAQAETRYHIKDLGVVQQFASQGINSSGVVVGTTGQAAVYDHGKVKELYPLLHYPSWSDAVAINDAGAIAGTTYDVSFRATAFVLRKGKAIFIADQVGFPGSETRATGINQKGHVTGSATLADDTTHAFLFKNGWARDLGVPTGATAIWAYGINDQDVVVGGVSKPDMPGRAFRWQDGKMEDLGTPTNMPASSSVARAVNNNGLIVGHWSPDINQPPRAAMWKDARAIDLGTLPGAVDGLSAAQAVNDAGVIVGEARMTIQGAAVAFVYDAEGMHDMNLLVDRSGADWTLTAAQAINAAGVISGYGRFQNDTHLFLATPIR